MTTASGATAVQVVATEGRRHRVLEHLGSAHPEAGPAASMHRGHEGLHAGQEALDRHPTSGSAPAAGVLIMDDRRSRCLLDALGPAWHQLRVEVVDDEAFFQLAAAHPIELTSISRNQNLRPTPS
ncbi:hypothetical protein BH708_07800 [Brachybacterium sp. P6-10-X1]|nr:hypothetical protein BH708_07800 [Brachybacterium sp. P6-10-X1]